MENMTQIIDGTFNLPPLEIDYTELKVGDEIIIWGTPFNPDFFPCRLPGWGCFGWL